MSTVITEQILLDAQQQLQDSLGVTYDYDALYPYLNLAIKEIVNLKPEAYAVTEDLTLAAGSIQSLGSTDIQLMDVVCNLGTGTTSVIGTTITPMKKGNIDRALPNWMTYTADAVVKHVITDERNPKTFYVFPPQPSSGTGKIQVVVSQAPDDITDISDEFPLDLSYVPAAVDYLVYRALSEETSIPNAQAKAMTFKNKFLEDLGLKSNQEKQTQSGGA